MNLDLIIHKGESSKPAFIFIHGLGMNKNWWADPSKARVMGGLAPLSLLLKNVEGPYSTLFHDAASLGHTVVTWSQRRPVGPMAGAVEELKSIIETVGTDSGLVLVGHSRGGLIARGVLDPLYIRNLKALVTISTPHLGSSMAKWAVYLSPLAELLDPIVPKKSRGTLLKSVNKIIGFFESQGVRELLPGSEFIGSLKNEKPGGAFCLSAAGTSPSLIRIDSLFSIPEVLGRVMPGMPEEILSGKGDGLVSARSARLPFADEHLDFHLNHAEMLVSPKVRKRVLEKIGAAL